MTREARNDSRRRTGCVLRTVYRHLGAPERGPARGEEVVHVHLPADVRPAVARGDERGVRGRALVDAARGFIREAQQQQQRRREEPSRPPARTPRDTKSP